MVLPGKKNWDETDLKLLSSAFKMELLAVGEQVR